MTGLYIHVPFCSTKCSYCDFLSFKHSLEIENKYVINLCKEIRYLATSCEDEVSTIYIGGGTPSLLSIENIIKIRNSLEYFNLSKNIEFTIEANPGSINEDKLSIYKDVGINRLSLGMQSLRNEELLILGRKHTKEDFINIYEISRLYFDNISVDLIYAIPDQSMNNLRYTLEGISKLSPEHISLYGLIIEKGTLFYKLYGDDDLRRKDGETPLYLPNEETEEIMYYESVAYFEKLGYELYEISNLAKNNKYSLHNQLYWHRDNYIGIGLGASSCIDNFRYRNITSMSKYCDIVDNNFFEDLKVDKEMLTYLEVLSEYIILGLRLKEGISLSKIKELSFNNSNIYENIVDTLKKQSVEGLVNINKDKVSLSKKGIFLSNYVMKEYVNIG